MNDQNPINIIAIHWGTTYTATDVNNLYSMICRNTSLPIRFHLFSNEPPKDLLAGIKVHAEPVLNVDPAHNKNNYRKEAGLCAENLAGFNGKRVFFFDLDVLITGNLDELFTYPEDDNFYIINDWNTKGDHVGQATCFSFVVGTLGFVKKAFEADPESALEKFGTASQEYLSAKVIERFGSLNFWPEEWFQSFRYHCLPNPLLRHFKTPVPPKEGTKVLAFHGRPDIKDALVGQWLDKKKHHWKVWKKLYKHCRPTPWIKTYWHSLDTPPILKRTDRDNLNKIISHRPGETTCDDSTLSL